MTLIYWVHFTQVDAEFYFHASCLPISYKVYAVYGPDDFVHTPFFKWMNQLLVFQESGFLIGFTGFFLGNYLQSRLHILSQLFLLTAGSQASRLCLIRRAVEPGT